MIEKRWKIKSGSAPPADRGAEAWVVRQLLKNRGVTSGKAVDEFLNPPPPHLLISSPLRLLGLNQRELQKAVKAVKLAIEKGRPIIIHGDYDVDGLCGAAILWEAIYNGLDYKDTLPFIPNRFKEGYGLSKASVDAVAAAAKNALLITADCGINADEAVDYASLRGMDVIVTDHHQKRGKKGEDGKTAGSGTKAVVWTNKLCGAGVAWVLAENLMKGECKSLDLVALASIADLQPLVGPTRCLTKAGLEELGKTKRAGLRALIEEAGLEGKKLGTYEVGWMIAPRLNAAGRLEKALDSLRLLCTPNRERARLLAKKLSRLNSERQRLTNENLERARQSLSLDFYNLPPILVVEHESYHEGVVGLIAAKLCEEFYRPAVAISRMEKISKGSARSVPGLNIIEIIKTCGEYLIDAGGHPMAAGFSIATERIEEFSRKLTTQSQKLAAGKKLRPTITIDVEVKLPDLTWKLWEKLVKFEPHGIGNPRPVFLTRGVEAADVRTVGSGGRHLKLRVRDPDDSTTQPFCHFDCIGFGLGEWALKLLPQDKVDLVYNLEADEWNGQKRLQLKLQDIKVAGDLGS